MTTLDPATTGSAHAIERLATEKIGWLTTIDLNGQPQSSPIWFLWLGEEVLVYSHIRAHRNANIETNSRVSFNLDTAAEGDDYVTMEGETRVDFRTSIQLGIQGGLCFGLFAMSRLPQTQRAWPLALGTFLAAQAAARWLAPADLNVNLAHGIYPGWERWFGSHAAYWLFTATAAAALLWLTDRFLPRFALRRMEVSPS